MNREEAKTTMSKLIDVFRKEYPSGAFAYKKGVQNDNS